MHCFFSFACPNRGSSLFQLFLENQWLTQSSPSYTKSYFYDLDIYWYILHVHIGDRTFYYIGFCCMHLFFVHGEYRKQPTSIKALQTDTRCIKAYTIEKLQVCITNGNVYFAIYAFWEVKWKIAQAEMMPLLIKYPFYITLPVEKVFSNHFAHAMQNPPRHAFSKIQIQ